MSDIHHSPMWNEAYSDDGVFKGDPRGIALGICADGVNPFSHLRTTYSMCPIVLSLLNLPRKVRHNFGNLLLVGIVPGNGRQEAKSIQPYLEILVDELISLSNATIFDAYQRADFKLKVEILLHILDYPGIGNITGSGAYKGCAWCEIRGMFVYVCASCTLCNKLVHDIYEGTHSKALSKMIYLESRRFLPSSSPLRLDKHIQLLNLSNEYIHVP